MAKLKVKLDTSKLVNEFELDTHYLKSEEDLNSEVSYEVIIDYIMMMIDVVSEELIEN